MTHGKKPAIILVHISIYSELSEEDKKAICAPVQPMIPTRQQFYVSMPGACLVVPVDEEFNFGKGL